MSFNPFLDSNGGGSGFTPTQEQLDAMNSGIDTTKVAQIETNADDISLIKQVPTVESTDDGKVLTASYNNGAGAYSWQSPSGGVAIYEAAVEYVNSKYRLKNGVTIDNIFDWAKNGLVIIRQNVLLYLQATIPVSGSSSVTFYCLKTGSNDALNASKMVMNKDTNTITVKDLS